jgi:hypothetical protein
LDIRKAEASNDVTFAYSVPETTKSMTFEDFATWFEEFPQYRSPGNNIPAELPGLDHLDRLYKKLRVNDEDLNTPRWKTY